MTLEDTVLQLQAFHDAKSRRTRKCEDEYEVVWEGDGREDSCSWHIRT